LPDRDDDSLGIGFGVAKVSPLAGGLDADTAFFSGSPFPVRGSETFIEVTYQYQATGWWQLQPDFQYVVNPGGGILDPSRPGRRVRDAAVLGLRTAVTF
jgi:porin